MCLFYNILYSILFFFSSFAGYCNNNDHLYYNDVPCDALYRVREEHSKEMFAKYGLQFSGYGSGWDNEALNYAMISMKWQGPCNKDLSKSMLLEG